MMTTKSVKIVSDMSKLGFEDELEYVLKKMEENVEIRDIDVKFPSSNDNGVVHYTALVIGRGV